MYWDEPLRLLVQAIRETAAPSPEVSRRISPTRICQIGITSFRIEIAKINVYRTEAVDGVGELRISREIVHLRTSQGRACHTAGSLDGNNTEVHACTF